MDGGLNRLCGGCNERAAGCSTFIRPIQNKNRNDKEKTRTFPYSKTAARYYIRRDPRPLQKPCRAQLHGRVFVTDIPTNIALSVLPEISERTRLRANVCCIRNHMLRKVDMS